jgi:hypothetical protein
MKFYFILFYLITSIQQIEAQPLPPKMNALDSCLAGITKYCTEALRGPSGPSPLTFDFKATFDKICSTKKLEYKCEQWVVVGDSKEFFKTHVDMKKHPKGIVYDRSNIDHRMYLLDRSK